MPNTPNLEQMREMAERYLAAVKSDLQSKDCFCGVIILLTTGDGMVKASNMPAEVADAGVAAAAEIQESGRFVDVSPPNDKH